VAGQLSLGGTLAVSLIGSSFGLFEPKAGDSFDILDWDSVSSAFTSINLPELAGLAWDTSQLYSTGVLVVVAPVLLEADFDEDGDVDGFDLSRWRKGFGAVGSATHMQGDADGDADVDGADFLAWQRQLGSLTTAAATAPVTLEARPTGREHK
jgi:hypothetical protein